jgi:hypothetical protein
MKKCGLYKLRRWMMLAAKFAAPYESNPVFHLPALEHTADRLITLFVAPPGYLYAGALAEGLKEIGGPLL